MNLYFNRFVVNVLRVSHSAKVYAHKEAGGLDRGGETRPQENRMGSGAVMRSSCLTMTLCCGGSVAVTWKAVRRELAR